MSLLYVEAYGIVDNGDGYWIGGHVAEQSGMVSCGIENGGTWIIEVSDDGELEKENCFDSLGVYGGMFNAKGEGFFSNGCAINDYGKFQLNVTRFNHELEMVWSKNYGNEDLSFIDIPRGTATTDGGVTAKYEATETDPF